MMLAENRLGEFLEWVEEQRPTALIEIYVGTGGMINRYTNFSWRCHPTIDAAIRCYCSMNLSGLRINCNDDTFFCVIQLKFR